MTFTKRMEEAAAPFFLDRRGPRKIIIGVLLSLMPVVSFFSLGYILSVFQARLEGGGREGLPEWRKPGELFLRGVVFFLVVLTYSAIPFLFTSAAFAMLKMGPVFLPPAAVTLVIGALLWLAAIYVMPMAMAIFLRRRSIRGVFDLGEVWQRSLRNLSHYLQVTLANLAIVAAVSLPAIVNPVGYLLSSPLTFLAMVYLASLYGAICAEAFPRE